MEGKGRGREPARPKKTGTRGQRTRGLRLGEMDMDLVRGNQSISIGQVIGDALDLTVAFSWRPAGTLYPVAELEARGLDTKLATVVECGNEWKEVERPHCLGVEALLCATTAARLVAINEYGTLGLAASTIWQSEALQRRCRNQPNINFSIRNMMAKTNTSIDFKRDYVGGWPK
jgi:hypothetical protein